MIVGKITVANLILPELHVHVALKVPVRDKIACLNTFVHILCEVNEIGAEQKKEMTTALLRRERLGTTGVGNGMAIPHTRCEIDVIYLVFGNLCKAIDFDAIDDHAVDLVAMLIAPYDSGVASLKLLAFFSRLLRDDNNRCALRRATSLEHVSIVLQNYFKEERYHGSVVHQEVFSDTDWEGLISSWAQEKPRIREGRRAKARG